MLPLTRPRTPDRVEGGSQHKRPRLEAIRGDGRWTPRPSSLRRRGRGIRGPWRCVLLVLFLGCLVTATFLFARAVKLREPSGGPWAVVEPVPRPRRALRYFNESSPYVCRHTAQGREWVVDERGYVCRAVEVDRASGCCSETRAERRWECRGCDLLSACCRDYEMCVSCCLDPVKRRLVEDATAHHPSALVRQSVTAFDYCSATCRTSSLSVVHENTYVSDFHHCYGIKTPPLQSSPSSPPQPRSGVPFAFFPSPHFFTTPAPMIPSSMSPPEEAPEDEEIPLSPLPVSSSSLSSITQLRGHVLVS